MNNAPAYEELLAEVMLLRESDRRKSERIAYLERLLYGTKSDRMAAKAAEANQPGLFDELFDRAYDERAAQIQQTAQEIKAEAEKRRRSSKARSNRPAKYQYYGLEERRRELLPQGLDTALYDKIGQDETRILHREPAKVWVEVIVRPIYRLKSDKNNPSPEILQAPAPAAVIGGNHVGAALLAQLVTDKYVYHLPEYRQVRQYADMGVKLPASTINDWIHAVASKLYPLYESLGEQIRSRQYLQIDEVPWRIADTQGKSRKGYAWQFFDAPRLSRTLFLLSQRFAGGGYPPGAAPGLPRSNPDRWLWRI
ncbi:hypothetical protein E5358_14875 [Palleniella muris]|uniref:Uncharacterized protein n=1 Tax=Palleniella muris TaxID=3038145 RepID=A0AC61QLF0_9BACT|nr:transposase [Palleniella muris]TGX79463.1 hypothetical protein E5358_14875 [Palleniella muris]